MDLDLAALIQKEIAVKKQKIAQDHSKATPVDIKDDSAVFINKVDAQDENEIIGKVEKEIDEITKEDHLTDAITKDDFLQRGDGSILYEKCLLYLHKIIIVDMPAIYALNREFDDDGGDNEGNATASSDSGSRKIIKEMKCNLFPLLIRLRTRTLEYDLLISLSTTLYHLQKREKRQCLESYMKLSIGNLIWPIGVEQIGIHAKFNSIESKNSKGKKRSNILINDETRLWITTVKRLISLMFRSSELKND